MADEFPKVFTYTTEDDDSPVYAQSQLDEAVRAERSKAIREFCDKAGIKPSQEVMGLPDDVRMWRMETAVEARRSAIRARGETK